ncbi:hypothetical protein M758_6G036200 [Ceratodon purpureus]|uniref:Mediator complex subunit 19 n=1 Tax=Ceratodon purpureus TaxID=3225 RepID=A0A8T0HBP9_CERPU|nr:hypothetical protein KC19_6G039300 [Ceratodon purpureus]KAG0612546.1 hypothetical protein M758_6G036200 [Ceratodon purpureus]
MASNGESFFRLLSVAPRPRELTGAVDLISHYQLREQYETFCKKPLPTSISDSKYLSNVVGDIELRRGEGMELGQLIQGAAGSSMPSDRVPFQPFDIEVLRKAFTLKEAGPISLPESERGLPTAFGKGKDQDEERRKRKHKHRSKDKDKDKDKDKKKDRDKDKKRDKDKDRDRTKGENGEKKHKKKKRRHDGEEGDDGHKHKSKKASREVPCMVSLNPFRLYSSVIRSDDTRGYCIAA